MVQNDDRAEGKQRRTHTGLRGTVAVQANSQGQLTTAKSPARQRTRRRSQAASDVVNHSSEEFTVPQQRRVRNRTRDACVLPRKSNRARRLPRRLEDDSMLLEFDSCDEGDAEPSSPSRIHIRRHRRRKRSSPTARQRVEAEPMPCPVLSSPPPNPGALAARKRFLVSRLSPPKPRLSVMTEKKSDLPLEVTKKSHTTLEATPPRRGTTEQAENDQKATSVTIAGEVSVAREISPQQLFQKRASQLSQPHLAPPKRSTSGFPTVALGQNGPPEMSSDTLPRTLTTKAATTLQLSVEEGTIEGTKTAPAVKHSVVSSSHPQLVEKESDHGVSPVIASTSESLQFIGGNTIKKATDNMPSPHQGSDSFCAQSKTGRAGYNKAKTVETITDNPCVNFLLKQAINKTRTPVSLASGDQRGCGKKDSPQLSQMRRIPETDKATKTSEIPLVNHIQSKKVGCSEVSSSKYMVSSKQDKSNVHEDTPSPNATTPKPGYFAQNLVDDDCNTTVGAEIPSQASCESPLAQVCVEETTASFDSPFSLQLSTWEEQAVSYLTTSNESEGTTVTTTRCRTEVTWVETKTVCDVTMQDDIGHTTNTTENHGHSKGSSRPATKGTKTSYTEPGDPTFEKIPLATSSPASVPQAVAESPFRGASVTETETQSQERKAQNDDANEEEANYTQICNTPDQTCGLPSLKTGPLVKSTSASPMTSVAKRGTVDCHLRSIQAKQNATTARAVIGNSEPLQTRNSEASSAQHIAINGNITKPRITSQPYPEECTSHQAAAYPTKHVAKLRQKNELGNRELLPGSKSYPISIRSDSSSSEEASSTPCTGPAAHRRRRATKQTSEKLARLEISKQSATLSSPTIASAAAYKRTDQDEGSVTIFASNRKRRASKGEKQSNGRFGEDTAVVVQRKPVRSGAKKTSDRKSPPPKAGDEVGARRNVASSLAKWNVPAHRSHFPLSIRGTPYTDSSGDERRIRRTGGRKQSNAKEAWNSLKAVSQNAIIPDSNPQNHVTRRSTANVRKSAWAPRDIPHPQPDSSSEEEWQDHKMFTRARETICTVGSFCKIWRAVEDDLGELTEDVEEGKLVRDANHHVEGSVRQNTAMYGRTTFRATDILFRVLELDPSCDIFLDFGHGIGNAVIQAAFTKKCPARGIEIDDKRFYLSDVYRKAVGEAYNKLWHDRDGISFSVSCEMNLYVVCSPLIVFITASSN